MDFGKVRKSIKEGGAEVFFLDFSEKAKSDFSKSNKKRVMKRAWNRARRAAEKFGGKASDYMWGAEGAVANAWKSEKRLVKPSIELKRYNEEDDADKDGDITEAEIKYNILTSVLEDAQAYSGTTTGAIMENDNGSAFLEYLEDVRKDIGVEKLISNVEKEMSVNSLAKLLEELVRAHYDPTYASWATGTENFKSELRKIEKAVEGASSDSLVNVFDFA